MPNTMKIAFLTPEFPHPKTGTSGGIGTSIRNLAKSLAEKGHKAVILVYGQSVDNEFFDGQILVKQIKNVKVKGFSWLLTRLKLARIINKMHREKQIDLVEAADWTGITAFMPVKCPVIVRLNGSDSYFCHLDQRPVKKFTRFLEKTALRQATALLSASQYTALVSKRLFSLERDFTVIPNSIDASAFVPIPASDTSTVLYFGTLIRKKGLMELPLIFNMVVANNPHARLVLIGNDARDVATGSLSTWDLMKEKFTKEAFAATTYLGSVPYEQMQQQISKASVCVFPTFAEALPMAWLEAMAMEKAVVASSIGWAPEVIVDGESGCLAHPKDHQRFAACILELLAHPENRRQMALKARRQVLENFDTAVVTAKNELFYAKYLALHSPSQTR
jgi:glycosyltransferase involved in cell wall biosynthesis